MVVAKVIEFLCHCSPRLSKGFVDLCALLLVASPCHGKSRGLLVSVTEDLHDVGPFLIYFDFLLELEKVIPILVIRSIPRW